MGDCSGGSIAGLEIKSDGGDCTCLKQIKFNPDGTVTFVMTNGQSVTSGSLKGVKGDNGDPGAAGPTGPAGASLLVSDTSGLSTLGVAFESLLDDGAGGRAAFSLVADTLSTDGSALAIEAVFTTNAPVPAATQLVRVTFDGNALNTPLNLGFQAATVSKVIYKATLTRKSNTELLVELSFAQCDASIGGHTSAVTYIQTSYTIAGLDLTGSAYAIDVQGDSDVIGDITLESAKIIYLKK